HRKIAARVTVMAWSFLNSRRIPSPGAVPFNEVPDVPGGVLRGDSPAASPTTKQLACVRLGHTEGLRGAPPKQPGAPMLQKRYDIFCNPEPFRVRVSPVAPGARRRAAIVEARLVIVSPGGVGRVQNVCQLEEFLGVHGRHGITPHSPARR